MGQFGEHFGEHFDVVEVTHGHNGPIGIFDWLKENVEKEEQDKEQLTSEHALEAAHEIAVIKRSALITPSHNVPVIQPHVIIGSKHKITVRGLSAFTADSEIYDVTQDILDIAELIRRGLI